MARPLIAAAMALVLAGCGAGSTTTVIERTTVTQTVTSRQTSAPAPGSQSYSGNGTKTIGTITITRPSIIEWSCPGCAAFALTSHLSGTTAIAIGSNAHSGTSSIDPGSYADAQVVSNGDWTIRIVAQ